MSAKILVAIDGTSSRTPGYMGGGSLPTNESNTHKFFRLASGNSAAQTGSIREDGNRGGFSGHSGSLMKMFEHGPDNEITGSDSTLIFNRAWHWLRRELSIAPGADIYLVGHSRGAHIVTEMAIQLASHQVGDFQQAWVAPGQVRPRRPVQPVRFLGLFDAVDMTRSLGDTTRVPYNVAHCYHVMRSRRAGSRRDWGNTATEAALGVDFHTLELDATHGAIGGAVPEECEGGLDEKLSRLRFIGAAAIVVAPGITIGAGIGTAYTRLGDPTCRIHITAEQNAMMSRQAFDFVKNGAIRAGLRFG